MPILGIDEVGRGPLAGPLVVGAVVLPKQTENSSKWISELADSKKLSPRKRELLSNLIIESAPATGLGWVSNQELNEIGLMAGLRLATRRAVKIVQTQRAKFTEIVIDGNINFLSGTRLEKYTSTLIKGDALIKEISAASIIAKVARDHYMTELASVYPEYGFERHMGYGTKAHLAAIKQYGICAEHRLFCKPVAAVADTPKTIDTAPHPTTTTIGKAGEDAVCQFLEQKDHIIISRNYKTKYFEIDIISLQNNHLFFTEVKTRKHGNGLNAINSQKQNQMRFAAELFLHSHPFYRRYDPLLAVASVNSNYEILDWFPLD